VVDGAEMLYFHQLTGGKGPDGQGGRVLGSWALAQALYTEGHRPTDPEL
jgi:hypothetical protein